MLPSQNAVKYMAVAASAFASLQIGGLYVSAVGVPDPYYAVQLFYHPYAMPQSSVLTAFSLTLNLFFCVVACFVYWAAEMLGGTIMKYSAEKRAKANAA